MAKVHDISPEMVRLSRIIDRLPAGKYVIEIDKPRQKEPWPYSIREAKDVRGGKLERYQVQ